MNIASELSDPMSEPCFVLLYFHLIRKHFSTFVTCLENDYLESIIMLTEFWGEKKSDKTVSSQIKI